MSKKISKSRLSLQRARAIRKLRQLSDDHTPISILRYNLSPDMYDCYRPPKMHQVSSKSTGELFPTLFSNHSTSIKQDACKSSKRVKKEGGENDAMKDTRGTPLINNNKFSQSFTNNMKQESIVVTPSPIRKRSPKQISWSRCIDFNNDRYVMDENEGNCTSEGNGTTMTKSNQARQLQHFLPSAMCPAWRYDNDDVSYSSDASM